jgi:hypothetical protein
VYEGCQYLRRAYLKLGYIYTAACTSVPRIELAENATFQALRRIMFPGRSICELIS